MGGFLDLKPTVGYQISTLIFGFFFLWRGVYINISWKIYSGRQSSCPIRIYIKGIVRAFKWLKCLGGFLHLKPTPVCQISSLIFEKQFCGGGSLWISHEKYIPDGKVLAHFGFTSKVLSVPLSVLSAWVGFCTSSPQQCVKYRLWYLNIILWRGVSMNILWKIYSRRQSYCPLGA
jgi:hypothetical protein